MGTFLQRGVAKRLAGFLVLWLALFFPASGGPAWGGKGAVVDTINIATPEWEGQTNADGTGLFFEIIQRVYEPHGIRMTFHFVPWKRAQKLVSSREADAMLCVWREHACEEGQLLPRFPLFVEYTGVVFRQESIVPWRGINSLDGKTAVWLRGYDYHTFAHFASIRFAQWTEVDDYARAWELLANKRYDVYIDALIDLEHYIAAHQVDMTPYRLEVLWGEHAYVAFAPRERSKTLMAIYDAEIQKLLQSGDLERIYPKNGS